MNGFNDRLYVLLPTVVRQRDFASGDQPLRSLLSVISEQVDLLEGNIAQLYDNWFIETCQDWVVPYIGDLIGYEVLHEAGEPEEPARTSSVRALDRILIPRQDVANTIRARRRKGTLAALVELARDVAGWPAVAVEFDRLSSVTQAVNDLRTGSGRTIDIRDATALDGIGGPWDAAARTAEFRGALPATGTLPTSGIGVFVPRYRSYSVSSCVAVWVPDTGDHCFTFSPLGDDVPLFAAPPPVAAESGGAVVLPAELTRRDVNRDAYYGIGKSLAIWTRGEDEKAKPKLVPRDEIVPADLTHWRHEPHRGTVAVDAKRGRISFPPAHVPDRVLVSYHYGFSFEVGAGEYPRALVAPPAVPLSAVVDGSVLTFGGTSMAGIDVNVEVDSTTAKYFTNAADTLTSVASAVALAIDALGIRGISAASAGETVTVTGANSLAVRFPSRLYRVALSDDESHDRLAHALGEWRKDRPARGVVEFEDSEIYDEDELEIALEKGQYLQIRAASGKRPVIRVTDWRSGSPDPIRIGGGDSTTLCLDGLLIAERGLRVTGDLALLTIRNSTLVPGWTRSGRRAHHGLTEPSIAVDDAPTTLHIERSITGPIHVKRRERAPNPSSIHVSDSILDAAGHGDAIASPDAEAANAELRITRTTVFGKVRTHAVSLAENTIFDDKVVVSDRQRGCFRFCYVPPDSRTPARYECQPEGTSSVAPVFISKRYDDPGYARLADQAPAAIRSGADDRSEMGVFHDLFLPQRETNLQARLAEYVPAGVAAAIIFVS